MELKIVTLNVWGLFVGGKYIKERLLAISDELKAYDIACLQEVWSREDYEDLVIRLSSRLPHSHHFKSGIIGSGLCIFSKYPIVSAIGHEFRVTSGLRKVKDGEVFAGKGALCCKIDTPQGVLAVFTTHTCGGRRHSHFLELMQFVQHVRYNHPVIITGDFNTEDKHIAYKLLTECLGLKDSFSGVPNHPTCNLPSSVFTKQPSKAKRIDYVFYSDDHSQDMNMDLVTKRVCMSEPIPGEEYPYSDHAGIEVVFNLGNTRRYVGIEDDGTAMTTSHLPPTTYRGLELNDNAIKILHKVSADITEQMNTLYHFNVQKHSKHVIFGLVMVLFVTYLILGAFNEALYKYHVHWLTMPVMCVVSVLLMVGFSVVLNELRLRSGMTANIDEINTIINYQKIRRRPAMEE